MKNIAQRFTEKYLTVQNIYDEVNNIFSKFENKELPSNEQSRIISDALADIKYARSVLKKLNIRDVIDATPEFKEKIKKNIDFYEEAFNHFYDRFTEVGLYDEISDSVAAYIKNMRMLPSDYKKYADDEHQLTAKFTNVLVRNVDLFKNQIKRMAIGTLSQKEFEKIYKTNKNKMIPNYSFESFSNY